MPDAPETFSPALAEGYRLQEYTILSVLGIGGFGITYLAGDNHLQARVAIKEFFPANLAVRNHTTGTVGIKSSECTQDFTWGRERYAQEAKTLAKFDHASIIRVYRYFETNGTSYMVMPYEDGLSLSGALAIDEEWPESRILKLLTPLLDGLASVHQAGILHRDIKPENILIRSRDGSPVLLDFGSARSVFASHTMTALVTPGYGPVEQYSDEGDQGPWSDIYSMAAVLYRVIAKRAPVPAPNRIKKDSLLPAVFAGRGRYSPAFLEAIDAALAIDSETRPQTIAQWLALLAGEPRATLVETMPSAPDIVDLPPTAPQPSRPVAARRAPIAMQSGATAAKAPVQANSGVSTALGQLMATLRGAWWIDPFEPSTLAAAEAAKAAPAAAIPTIAKPTLTRRAVTRPVMQAGAAQVSPKRRRGGVAALAGAIIAVALALGVVATDSGFLRVAYFAYTAGVEARSHTVVYALVCPSYFHSEMSLNDLAPSWPNTQATRFHEQFQSLSIDTPAKATIMSSVWADGVPMGDVAQTWMKNGVLWCRDAAADAVRVRR